MSYQKPFDPTKPVVVSQPIAPGPTSQAGKEISSRNSLKHGCCAAATVILKSENLEDFKALEASYLKFHNPKDEHERHLVQELVLADWFYQRSTRAAADVEADLYEAEPKAILWTEQQQRTMGRFLRYQTTRQNILSRARKAIEDHHKCRAAEKASEGKRIIAKERHELHKQKHKPEPTWDETIDLMRRQAIALGLAPSDPTKK